MSQTLIKFIKKKKNKKRKKNIPHRKEQANSNQKGKKLKTLSVTDLAKHIINKKKIFKVTKMLFKKKNIITNRHASMNINNIIHSQKYSTLKVK